MSEMLYPNVDAAIKEASLKTPNTIRIAIASDFANLSRQGYDAAGNITFKIYRTFDTSLKQKYQIRYCYIES